MSRLPPAPALEWTPDGAPRATAFGDSYFSRDGGLAESEAVFLSGCGLPEAWRGRDRFAICELGFGTGLNVLALWRLWRRTREPGAILHVYSIEALPMDAKGAARSLAAFPDISALSEQLLARWPVRAYAPQRLWFPDDGFALTLLTGDAEDVLAGLEGQFDAWFLDGFAPSRNAAMWTPALLQRVAALCASNARLATFTVAGDVRRALEGVGFRVEKKPGFGAKRERLEAIWTAGASPASSSLVGGGAGGPYPLYPRNTAAPPKRVAIIGAGIAGAATAAALARRNIEAIVLEAAPILGAGASGNPAGLVAPRLDRDASAISTVFLAAYLEAIATYSELGPDVFKSCGLEEGAGARDAEVIAALLNDPPLPPDWLARRGAAAAFYPQAGVLTPLSAIQAFLRDASLMCEAPVASIERAGETWRLVAPDGRAWLHADVIVLASGAALGAFEPARFLPLQYSRGQIEWGALHGAPPDHAQLGACYAAPFADGLIFGATFDRVEPEALVEPNQDSRARNLAALQRLAPDLAQRLNHLGSRAALRVSTPDRAPIAGLMPDAGAWLAQNAGIAHGRPPPDLPAPRLDGVYVIGALGARGLTLAPLLGELIAAEICGEPALLPRRALDCIHPARFLHRALKKDATI